MKQPYLSPRITDYGSLLAVTGVTGDSGFEDVQTYVSSSFIARGNGPSWNTCPPSSPSECIT